LKDGRVDISFNAVRIPGYEDSGCASGPLVELDVEQFSLPITTYATSYFLTVRSRCPRPSASLALARFGSFETH
jgi:hypothetical protein